MALFNFSNTTNDESGNFNSNSGTPSQPATPAPTETPAPEEEISGLDKLNQLLYPEKSGDGNSDDPREPEPPVDPTKIFDDPESVNKILSTIDFTKNISEDTLKLLDSNDPKGLTSLVNDTAKASFLEALKLSSHLNKQTVDDAVKRALEQSKGQITESLGDYELNQAMPEISNPVIRLGLDAVKNQLKTQNPSMSPRELANHLKAYLKEANETVNAPTQPEGNQNGQPTDAPSWVDWVQNS